MAETGVALFNRTVELAMAIPGTKVDRYSFLRKEFGHYCGDRLDLVVEGNPRDHVSMDLIDHVANNVINAERIKVSFLSAATGLPSNPALATAAAALDMQQYMATCLRTSQELAYLYGFPDLLDEYGEVSSSTITMITPLVGIMFGVKVANELTAKLCQQIVLQSAKRLSLFSLSRPGWYTLAKQVAKFIGVKMSRQLALKGVTKIVPLVGGAVSGALTYAAFGPSANRLKEQLRENCRFIVRDRPLENSDGAQDLLGGLHE